MKVYAITNFWYRGFKSFSLVQDFLTPQYPRGYQWAK